MNNGKTETHKHIDYVLAEINNQITANTLISNGKTENTLAQIAKVNNEKDFVDCVFYEVHLLFDDFLIDDIEFYRPLFKELMKEKNSSYLRQEVETLCRKKYHEFN